MFHWIVTASLKDIVEADNVALDVGVGVGYRVANAGLCCEVDNDVEFVCGKYLLYESFICNVANDEVPLVCCLCVCGEALYTL